MQRHGPATEKLCLRDVFVFFLCHTSRHQPIAVIGGRCRSRAELVRQLNVVVVCRWLFRNFPVTVRRVLIGSRSCRSGSRFALGGTPPWVAVKLSVRDVDPDGSRSGEWVRGGGGGADSDELLNDNDEQVRAPSSRVAGPSRCASSTPPKSRPPPSPPSIPAITRRRRWSSCRRTRSRDVVNEVGSREAQASKRLPDLIRREAPTLRGCGGAVHVRATRRRPLL